MRSDINRGAVIDMDGKCVTVFSSSAYCGYKNRGAVVVFREGSVAPRLCTYDLVNQYIIRETSWWSKAQGKKKKPAPKK
jgi:hypothetical protein